MEFIKFNKIPRLSRDCTISEKLDGTSSQIVIVNKDTLMVDYEENRRYFEEENFIKQHSLYETENLFIFAGSRNRWLSVDNGKNCDNHGFARWVKENAEELLKLGEGRFFGEYFGKGINRNYGLDEKRFALFNVRKWCNWNEEPKLISINQKTKEEKYQPKAPKCCSTVPILYEGMFDTQKIEEVLQDLKEHGSYAVPNYMNPEGIIINHQASGQLFKKTIENDTKPKGDNHERKN